MTDARKEQFEAVGVCGVPALFTVNRIDRKTVPKGMYAYDMRTSADDWSQPCLLARQVTVDHYGTVLTATPIDLPRDGCRDLTPEDFVQGSGMEQLTTAEFEDRCFSRPAEPRHRSQAKPARTRGAPAR